MTLQKIEELIRKYERGETSLEEELELAGPLLQLVEAIRQALVDLLEFLGDLGLDDLLPGDPLEHRVAQVVPQLLDGLQPRPRLHDLERGQQVGGFDCNPVSGELTYGLERLATYVQGVDRVYDLDFNGAGQTYGDVFHRAEREYSAFNFEHADTEMLSAWFHGAERQCKALLELDTPLPLPAYDYCLKASHLFNMLDARGVISPTERQSFIARVRDLAKGCAEAWVALEKEAA